MQMPVVVGMIIALMALVTFSGWFFEYAAGMRELVLDDRFFNYRIVATTVGSILFMVVVFGIIAVVNECPNQTREGIFSGLKCEGYLEIKASADRIFQPKNQAVDQTL